MNTKSKIPQHWKQIVAPLPENQTVYEHKLIQLRVIISISDLKDGSKWFHISVSRPDRCPSWDELMKIKNEFLGEEREAYQVLPKKSDHVNICGYCLHFWARVDGKRVVANLQDIVMEKAI